MIPNEFKAIEEGIIFFRKLDDDFEKVFAVYKCPDPERFYSYTYGTD